MDKTEFETLRKGDLVEILGWASSVEIIDAEVYGGKACSITVTGGNRMKIGDSWVASTNLLRRATKDSVSSEDFFEADRAAERKIQAMGERQLRIALLAVHAGHNVYEAIDIAETYSR